MRALARQIDDFGWSIADSLECSKDTVPVIMALVCHYQDTMSLELLTKHFLTMLSHSQRAPAIVSLHNMALFAIIVCMQQARRILSSDANCCLIERSGGLPALSLSQLANVEQDHPNGHYIRLLNQLTALMLEANQSTFDVCMKKMYDALAQFDHETHGAVVQDIQTTVSMSMITFVRTFWHTDPEKTIVLLGKSRLPELQAIMGVPPLDVTATARVDTVCFLAGIERLINDVLLRNYTTPVDHKETIMHIYNRLMACINNSNDGTHTPLLMNYSFVMLLPYTQSALLLLGILARMFVAAGMPLPDDLSFRLDTPSARSLMLRMIAEYTRIKAWKDGRLMEDAHKACISAVSVYEARDNEIIFDSCILPPTVCGLLIESDIHYFKNTLNDNKIIETLFCLAACLGKTHLIPPNLSPMFGVNVDLLLTARQISELMSKLTMPTKNKLPCVVLLQKWIERVQRVCSPFPTRNTLFNAMFCKYD